MFIASSNSGKRIGVYLRVSTQEQETDGFGLETQEQGILGYIKNDQLLGQEDVEVEMYSDSHTGSNTDRPDLKRLLDDIKNKRIDTVIVWKLDRLSRSLKHIVELAEFMEKHGVSFISVQERVDFSGPIGQLMFHMFSSFAEFERHLINDRTLSGKITSAKRGNYVGGWAPYGYKKVVNPDCPKGRNTLEIVQDQAAWVKKVFHWYVFENLSFQRIANKLNKLDIPYTPESRSSKNDKWSEFLVFKMIGQTIYKGEYVSNKKGFNGTKLPKDQWTITRFPAIVDEVLWSEAQKNRSSRQKYHGKNIYLLTGKVIDKSCEGKRTFIGINRTKGGISYRRKAFLAPSGKRYANFELSGKALEEYIWGLIVSALSNPQKFYDTYLQSQKFRTEFEQLSQAQLLKMKNRIKNIEELEIPRIQDAFEKGAYDVSMMKERLDKKKSEMSKLDQKLKEHESSDERVDQVDTGYICLKELSKDYKESLEDMTDEQKKVLCQHFVDRIDMTKGTKEGRPVITGKVRLHFKPVNHSSLAVSGRTSNAALTEVSDDFLSESLQCGETANAGYTKSGIDTNLEGRFAFNFKLKKWNEKKVRGEGGVLWKSKFIDC